LLQVQQPPNGYATGGKSEIARRSCDFLLGSPVVQRVDFGLFVSAGWRLGHPRHVVALSVSVCDPDPKTSGQTDYKLQIARKVLPKPLTFANLA
jgi:hypothetical protein